MLKFRRQFQKEFWRIRLKKGSLQMLLPRASFIYVSSSTEMSVSRLMKWPLHPIGVEYFRINSSGEPCVKRVYLPLFDFIVLKRFKILIPAALFVTKEIERDFVELPLDHNTLWMTSAAGVEDRFFQTVVIIQNLKRRNLRSSNHQQVVVAGWRTNILGT